MDWRSTPKNDKQEHQFAFRKGLGAELQIIKVVEKIKEEFRRKDLTEVVLLDVDKALDRVWRDGLTQDERTTTIDSSSGLLP